MNRPVRVAIFEDNDELRDALSRLVASAPDMVLAGSFASCERVEEDAASCAPQVVLMDLGLPQVNGIEGTRRLKAAQPAVDVLILTVHEDEQRIFESVCAGASGYLLKKSTSAAILGAIREVRSGGSPMTPAIARRVLRMFQAAVPAPPGDCALTGREKEVLTGLVSGYSYKMIAADCGISIDTVRTHIKRIYEKLHVHSKSEAVARAIRERLV